jgi:hypothetical protein
MIRALKLLLAIFLASSVYALERANVSSRPGEAGAAQSSLSYRPKMLYSSRGRRDPFVSSIFSKTQRNVADIRLIELSLSGFVESGGRKSVFFTLAGGTWPLLVLKQGVLYLNEKPVPGMKGKLLDSKRVVLSQGEEMLTYTLYTNHR